MHRKSLKFIQKELSRAFKNLEKAKQRNDSRAVFDIKQKIGILKYIKELLKTANIFDKADAEQSAEQVMETEQEAEYED